MMIHKYMSILLIIATKIYAVYPWVNQFNPDVYLLCPNGGEILAWDSTYIIRWELYGGVPGVTYDYIFALSIDGGQSFPYPITGTLNQDSSTLEWVVPHMNSNLCRVYIEVDSAGAIIASDISDGDFTISVTEVEEKDDYQIHGKHPRTIILVSPLQDTVDNPYAIFDITGRRIHTLNPAPGIYFVKINGEIKQKIIKIR